MAHHPRFKPNYGPLPQYNPSVLSRYAPTAALWGVGVAAAVTLFASSIPLFQKDVLDNIPVVRGYFKDTTPDSDKPF